MKNFFGSMERCLAICTTTIAYGSILEPKVPVDISNSRVGFIAMADLVGLIKLHSYAVHFLVLKYRDKTPEVVFYKRPAQKKVTILESLELIWAGKPIHLDPYLPKSFLFSVCLPRFISIGDNLVRTD